MAFANRTTLLAGAVVAVVAALALAFVFVAPRPDPGTATQVVQLPEAEPVGRAAEAPVAPPRPSEVPPAAASSMASADTPSGLVAPAPSVASEAATAPVPAGDEGDDLYRRGLYPEALEFWRAKAAAGDVYAAFRLGIELIDGKPGVTQRDFIEARRYLQMAADKGHPRAQFELGSMYEYGMGVDRSTATAADWYRKSAEAGYAQAQYNYATMLETGDGVTKDEIEALKFYLLAGEQGFQGVGVNEEGAADIKSDTPLMQLMDRLTSQQIAEARQRAVDFVITTSAQ